MHRLSTLVLIAAAYAATPAVAQDPAAAGRALLAEQCARCHAIDKTGISPHESAPAFRIIGRSFEFDELERHLRGGIAASHPDMPEVKFRAEDAHAVVVYLRSIQE